MNVLRGLTGILILPSALFFAGVLARADGLKLPGSMSSSSSSLFSTPTLCDPDAGDRTTGRFKSLAPIGNGFGIAKGVDCDLPFATSKDLRLPAPGPGCFQKGKAWEEGYRNGISGNSFPLGIRFAVTSFKDELDFSKKALQKSEDVIACSEFRDQTGDYQCCIDAFYKGMNALRNILENHMDDWKEKHPVSDQDRLRINQCVGAKLSGEEDGLKQCKYFSKESQDQSCPKANITSPNYRGCYLLGFMSKIQGCGCPVGKYASHYLGMDEQSIAESLYQKPLEAAHAQAEGTPTVDTAR